MRAAAVLAAALCAQQATAFVSTSPNHVSGSCATCRPQTQQRAAAAVAEPHDLGGRPIGGPLLPISNCVLVRIKDKAAATESGVIMPEGSVEVPNEGTVVAQGPGSKHPESAREMPMACSPGDKVLYGKFDGTSLTYDNKEHRFIRDTDIFLVYQGEKATPETVKMIRDQILVKCDDVEVKTASGLFLVGITPEEGEKKSTTGEVVAAGPGRMTPEGEIVPVTLKPGDHVKFRDYAGAEIFLDQARTVTYRVMREEDVFVKW